MPLTGDPNMKLPRRAGLSAFSGFIPELPKMPASSLGMFGDGLARVDVLRAHATPEPVSSSAQA